MNSKKLLTRGLCQKERAYEIDILRGIPIIVVVLYHICWTFSAFPMLFSNWRSRTSQLAGVAGLYEFVESILVNRFIHTYLVPFFGGLFLTVCGISTIFSKNNLKRAGLVSIAALVVSLVTLAGTYLLDSNIFIFFGILHTMALSILIYVFLNFLSKKIVGHELTTFSLFLITLVLSIVSLLISTGYMPFVGYFDPWPTRVIRTYPIDRLISEPWTYPLEIVGFVRGCQDSWPLLPYMTFIFLGISIGKLLYGKEKKTRIPKLGLPIFKPLCFIGRHTMWVYLLHQPVFLLIAVPIFMLMGYRI